MKILISNFIKSVLPVLALLTVCILISQCKKASNNNNTSSGCVASNQIDSAGGTWIYTFDSQGLLTTDSLVGGNSWTIGSTAYLNYAGSTVNVTYTLGQELITITVNSSGFPVSIATPDGNSCSATYNNNGTLNTFTFTSFGTPTTFGAVYANGNLVALTQNGTTVNTFTYYSNAVTVAYDPMAKLFALMGDWYDLNTYGCGTSNCGYSNGFNPQPFSKNLLQSVTSNNSGSLLTNSTYTYQYDNKGNVTYVASTMIVPAIDTSRSVAFYSYNCQ